jgi:hypothetical protein
LIRYFFGILLTVEENGQPVLSPTPRTILSLCLAILCIVAVLFGIFGIAHDVILLYTIHMNSFASHWIRQISYFWGETVQSGIIQFLYAIYSPLSRREIYKQRSRIKHEIKRNLHTLKEKFPEPLSFFNRMVFNFMHFKRLRHLENEEKKYIIPPQILLNNASRPESAFLICMNKIMQFDDKIFKTDDDRTGQNDPPIKFVRALQSCTEFSKHSC